MTLAEKRAAYVCRLEEAVERIQTVLAEVPGMRRVSIFGSYARGGATSSRTSTSSSSGTPIGRSWSASGTCTRYSVFPSTWISFAVHYLAKKLVRLVLEPHFPSYLAQICSRTVGSAAR